MEMPAGAAGIFRMAALLSDRYGRQKICEKQVFFYLHEQRAAAECEVFVCGERRDSEIKLAQRVLSRLCKE